MSLAPWILFIEDVGDEAEAYGEVLHRAGYNVATASGGQQGCGKARQMVPNAIVLDLLLPDMHGWDVFAELKRDRVTAHVPIIILSGLGEPDIERARLEGAVFLKKPCAPDVLERQVERTLAGM